MSRRALVIDGRQLAGAAGVDEIDDIGGKARGLLAIEAAGLETAPWLVLPASARPPDDRVSPALARAITRGIRALELPDGATFAVRSSGLDEDAAGRSFAGQYETLLDVPAVLVPEAVERCWRSAETESVRAYRAAMGLPADSRGMAIIVQSMVPAAFSGITFSAAPDGSGDAVIVAVPGLGAELAAGRRDGDELRVGADRTGVTRVRRAGGAGAELADADARRVADAARQLERRLGAPQDVEWCLTPGGELVIVQTRPITAMAARAPVRLWDNANIVESFPGLTLPLTFSIAREVYATVYRGACRALGVTEPAIRANADAFDGLLGHIRGRVYYDVGNWHRVLALLPAFRSNQALLERMMGAARPGGATGERATAVAGERIPLRSGITIGWRLFAAVATFERRARRFTAKQRATLRAARRVDLGALDTAGLVAHFDEVTRRVLGSWQLPIFNDLAVMLFHGSLRRAAERWCEPPADGAVNRLLRSGAHPGVAAATSLREIARDIRAEPAWLAALADPDAAAVSRRLASDPGLDGLRKRLAPYLAGWGGRSPGALHLDRPSLADDPRLLLVTLRDLAAAEGERGAQRAVSARDDQDDAASGDVAARDPSVRGRLAVRGTLPVRLLRTAVLRFLLRRARFHLTWRERMRLLRMDVFAVGREIVTALGRAWAAAGVLQEPADVHYLEIAEIRAAVHDPGSSAGLAAIVATRRLEYEALRREPPPPNRFESDGSAATPAAPPAAAGPPGSQAKTLVGIGVSPGRARGTAVVVREPRDVQTVAGRIVVAPSTDPGWLPLMLAASGLVVEQGSLLSHSAIVARELGLPAVVGVIGATTTLAPGQDVAIDGTAGTVEILEPEAGRDG